jgi:hypothetical protein
MKIVDEFNILFEGLRQGKMGKTPQLWVLYADRVWDLLRFLRAIKENNLQQYISCLRRLCPLMSSADRHNYARYLPVYYTQLLNLSNTHPQADSLLEEYGISVARNQVPTCRIPVDTTIEQTINRSEKTSGGLIGFTRNSGTYQRWRLTRHERANFLDATYEDIGIKVDVTDSHTSCTKGDTKKSENEVSRVKAAFENFINPFKQSSGGKDVLYCISSGQPASDEVQRDLLNYEKSGEVAVQQFITDRLVTKKVKFHDPIR